MEYRFLVRFASLAALAVFVSAAAPIAGTPPVPPVPRVTVFKDPNCGCCKDWITHLRRHGFEVVSRDTSDLSGVKRTGRVPESLRSCHTAFVSGYVVEGHVPASDMQRLLKEKPKVAGLAVPGMPVGSPGMEIGSRKDPYDVIAFGRDGETRVYAQH